MNQYANEEVMWQRLKDLQREAETSRLIAQSALPSLGHLLGLLAGRALRRPLRRPALRVVESDHEAAERVA